MGAGDAASGVTSARSAELVDAMFSGSSPSKGPMSYPVEPPELGAPAKKPHASPVVRAFARQLGVDLASVSGSGPHERVLIDDVQAYVRTALADLARAAGVGAVARGAGDGGSIDPGLPPLPRVDFAKFGPVESTPLSRLRRISGTTLARNRTTIPHVTQHDDADVTSLEAFRQQVNRENEKTGVNVTMVAFVMKAVVAALRQFPDFNASLDGEQLVRKRYFHIGFAVDTPDGLVVPVIRNADRKGVLQIADEMTALAALARDGKLGTVDVEGGCFSIAAPGAIDADAHEGGTYFTPIINAPEVAILGIGRSQVKPVWDGSTFIPRLMLPLSLSYDHRVIDGAAAARFITFIASIVSDFRRGVM